MDLYLFKIYMDLERNLDLISSNNILLKRFKNFGIYVDHIFGPFLNGGSRSFFDQFWPLFLVKILEISSLIKFHLLTVRLSLKDAAAQLRPAEAEREPAPERPLRAEHVGRGRGHHQAGRQLHQAHRAHAQQGNQSECIAKVGRFPFLKLNSLPEN